MKIYTGFFKVFKTFFLLGLSILIYGLVSSTPILWNVVILFTGIAGICLIIGIISYIRE